MVQSSITAWLRKPASVLLADYPTSTKPQAAVAVAEAPQPNTSSTPPDRVSDEASVVATVRPRQASIPSVFSLPPLPANVELVPLTEDLVPGFKRLNALLLPIAYPTAFYTETMTEPHHGVTLMALWSAVPPGQSASPAPEKPRLIGAIRCRILPSANLYISTIGVLSPYRSYGIATHLLQWIVLKASEEHGVRSITAHVWEANEDGLDWYKKRGFDVIGKEDGYYRKLRPSGAVLVRKWIKVGDLLGATQTPNELPE